MSLQRLRRLDSRHQDRFQTHQMDQCRPRGRHSPGRGGVITSGGGSVRAAAAPLAAMAAAASAGPRARTGSRSSAADRVPSSAPGAAGGRRDGGLLGRPLRGSLLRLRAAFSAACRASSCARRNASLPLAPGTRPRLPLGRLEPLRLALGPARREPGDQRRHVDVAARRREWTLERNREPRTIVACHVGARRAGKLEADIERVLPEVVAGPDPHVGAARRGRERREGQPPVVDREGAGDIRDIEIAAAERGTDDFADARRIEEAAVLGRLGRESPSPADRGPPAAGSRPPRCPCRATRR